MGGVGSRVVFRTWPALEAACARVCRFRFRMYVRASASAGGWGGGSPLSDTLVVHRGQDAEVAVVIMNNIKEH